MFIYNNFTIFELFKGMNIDIRIKNLYFKMNMKIFFCHI